MLQVRKAHERWHVNHGWLNSYHTFSFTSRDPWDLGWGPLLIINDDTVAPGRGFPTHGHRDMEIISYVLEGALEHKDTIGTGSVMRPGDVQVMEAGTGIGHSEFNHSREEPVRFLQIWIEPVHADLQPTYQQRYFAEQEKRGKLRLIVSPDGRDGSLRICQDVKIYSAFIDGEERIEWDLLAGSKGYIHVARGKIKLNGESLHAGDGVKLQGEANLLLSEGQNAEILVFDLSSD